MEVNWEQHQLEGYMRDSQRILRRLQSGNENRFLAERALDLLRTYVNIPADLPNRSEADENIAKLAEILYVYIQTYGYWETICLLWPKIQCIARSLPDPSIYAQLVKQRAIVKNDRGEVHQSQVLYDELLNPLNLTRLSPEQQADIFHQAGVCAYQQGHYAQAWQMFIACLAVQDATENCPEVATQSQRHQQGYALRVQTAAPPIWESHAYALNQLGNIAFYFRGNFKAAQQYYEASLQIFRAHNEVNNLACVVYQSLGSLYVVQGRFATAVTLLEKNFEIRQHRGEKSGSAHAAIYLAAAYLGQQRLDEAEVLLSNAMKTCHELQNQRYQALCHLYWGYLYRKRGDYPSAIAQWQQAETIVNSIPVPAIDLQVLAALATGLFHIGHFGELMTIVLRLYANTRQQSLGPLAAGRLLFHYLCW